MKMILRSAIAMAALSSVTAFTPNSALAGGVGVSIGIGVPSAVYVSPWQYRSDQPASYARRRHAQMDSLSSGGRPWRPRPTPLTDPAGNQIVNTYDLRGYKTENLCYDALNRLTNYSVNGASCRAGGLLKTVAYDALRPWPCAEISRTADGRASTVSGDCALRHSVLLSIPCRNRSPKSPAFGATSRKNRCEAPRLR